MSSVVFILGAGASKQAGTPLMNDFLDVAYDLWRMGKVSDAEESFRAVFEGRSALASVHSKAHLNIHNVEAVFAAFEMAKTLSKFADYSPKEIDALIKAMKTVIVKTIEQTPVFPIEGHRLHPPPPYRKFSELTKYLMNEAQPKQTVAVISFNYDVAVDYAFSRYDIPIDYALGEPKHRDSVPVLKLHGSLSWARCKACGKVVPWEMSSYRSKFIGNLPVAESMALQIGSHISHFEHCEGNVEREPFLVPPTWNKTEQHRVLASVWARAAKELGEAESIFVIGYSLPPSDYFFRHLYALGAVGEATLRRFWVFNPDENGEVEDRFEELLEPGAQQRFRYIPRTFDDSISILGDVFGHIPRAP